MYLIDRVPDELWTEVCDIVQETGIKTIPMEKKWKKAKWLSGEALQIAVKRREVKSKGEKERYKHLNAEFQRLARRDKKAFFRDQCKEIEKNNRMGKLEISSRKLETPREHFCKDGDNKADQGAEYLKDSMPCSGGIISVSEENNFTSRRILNVEWHWLK